MTKKNKLGGAAATIEVILVNQKYAQPVEDSQRQ